MQHALAPLASIRVREDALRSRLEAVRARLAECVQLVRRTTDADKRGGAYRSDARDHEPPTQASARAERARLRIEEAALMTELERTRARLEERGIRHLTLPILEDVTVATPCDASWAEMEGDSDTRFCGRCEKYVHNLSMMSRKEAEAVLTAATAERREMCVRLWRRLDGTVLTDDCPVGVRRRRFWRRTTGVAAAGLLLAALGSVAYGQLACSSHVVYGVGQGARGNFGP